MKTKGTLLLACAMLFAGSFTFAALPDFSSSVLPRLFEQGLTKYSGEADFRTNDAITRGEASKFAAQYAVVVGLEKTYTGCEFSDLDGYDTTLLPHILEACAYGLLKGSNGKFMPNDNITEAQAITVVVRTLEGFKDETLDPWYKDYFAKGKELGMIQSETEVSVDTTNVTRAKLGSRFYQATHGTDDSLDAEDEKELTDILEETINELFNDEVTTGATSGTDTTMVTNGYGEYSVKAVEDALKAGNNVVLFFHATRCPICQATNDALTKETVFPKNLSVFKVDYDTQVDLKTTYQITTQHSFVQLNTDLTAKANRQGSINLTEIVAQLK